MAFACKHNVALVPIGGGTNVTGALELSPNEKRMIVSLDMSQMVSRNIFQHEFSSFNVFLLESNIVDR